MARRRDREQPAPAPWETERTMADAEADDQQAEGGADRCLCGSSTFVLQGYSEVNEGRLSPRPIELEALTCPECGREYEPVEMEDGRILRGDYLGQVELSDDDEEFG